MIAEISVYKYLYLLQNIGLSKVRGLILSFILRALNGTQDVSKTIDCIDGNVHLAGRAGFSQLYSVMLSQAPTDFCSASV